MSLSIVVPVEITDAKLASTDVPETTPAAYDSGTTYAITDRVRHNHKIYESLQNSNVGNQPDISPAHWAYVQATNQWALFDLEQVTSTAQATSMTYELHPGETVTAVRTMGLHQVDSVRVRWYDETSDSVPVYDSGLSAAGLLPDTADWWAYCYGPWSTTDQLGFRYPSVAVDPKIVVDYAGSSNMSVGVLLLGNEHRFGVGHGHGVLSGARVRYDRRAAFQDNEFSIPTLTKRAVIATVNFSLKVASRDVDNLMDFYRDHGNKVCFFSVSDRWRITQILGLITSFETLLIDPVYSEFSIEIRGVPQQ